MMNQESPMSAEERVRAGTEERRLRGDAGQIALEREARAARPVAPSLMARLRRLFGR